MRRIRSDHPIEEPPRWAILERSLLDLLGEAIDPVLDDYLHDDGEFLWPTEEDHVGVDALDDAYESFHNWPLAYLLGADERLLELAKEEFDVITEQFTRYDTGYGHPMVVDEYEQGYDWFHQSEGYLFFYLICMADPADETFRERAERFADLYLNDHPDAPDLYDPEHRILTDHQPGSKGPSYLHGHRSETPEWGYQEWKKYYGLPIQIDGVDSVEDLRDPENARRMGEALRERWEQGGDVVQNLAATTMAANAYLLTGEEKYGEWISEYVEAWMERARENGGVIPDNVGLSGEVGENFDGRWYGGSYGWSFPHGWQSISLAVTVAAECAALIERDLSYLDLAREQFDELISRGIEREGTLHIPYKHGDEGRYDYAGEWTTDKALLDDDGTVLQRDGWYEFKPSSFSSNAAIHHLWHMSQDADDHERVHTLRDQQTRDWESISGFGAKDNASHEHPWLAYIDGEFPDYPERILEHNHNFVYDRLQFMREDDQDPATYDDNYLQIRNPVVVEGLIQCTMGAPQAIYHGGMQFGRVRHFDPERERPGLPEGVAALVSSLSPDRATLELVNLSPSEKETIVQAGSFAQHEFGTVSYDTTIDGDLQKQVVDVDDDTLSVTLAGGARTTLDMETDRFVSQPTYDFPWER